MTDYAGKTVWIVGASSGIGAALARELAGRGATLVLSARRAEPLERMAQDLPGTHSVQPLDVSDGDAVASVAAALPRIDSVIVMAALYTPMKTDALDLTEVRRIIDVNLNGTFNIVHAVLPILTAQNAGQIALCGSVAGYIGLPNSQPYSATKAGIANLTESLRADLPATIDVKLISPGFVETDLTRKNDFEMPLIITPEKAAKAIADGLLKSGFEIHFPKGFTLFLKLLQLLPYWLSLKITRKIGS